jgi:hypothetical protein
VSGSLLIARELQGSILGTSDVAGSLTNEAVGQVALQGASIGTSDVAATISITRTLISETSGTSSVSASLSVEDGPTYIAVPPTYFTVSTGEMRIDVTTGEMSIHTTTGKTYIDVG